MFKKFWADEDGAITVDWVVLTAGAVSMAVVLVAAWQDVSTGVTADTGSAMSQIGDVMEASGSGGSNPTP